MITNRILILSFVLSVVVTAAHADTFCRFEQDGEVTYGRVEGDRVRALTGAPWAGGKPVGEGLDLDQVRLLAPSVPSLIAGLAGAYRSAWPDGGEPPAVRWFVKPPTAAAAPDAPLVLPDFLDEIKVEVELVIVVGKTIKNASPEEALSSIFGYTLGNDVVGQVSSFQRLTGDSSDRKETVLAPALKGGDGFAPFGPFIHTDIDWRGRKRTLEISSDDPDRVVSDHTNTSDLIYQPEKVISDLSKVMTLRPGDVVFTGTNRSYPVRAGDRAKISIEGIGEIVTVIE
jgi:2-keto-4-pentenoate hydratase/2-oxohepta-3-ene-1,7-dioic acid hydratase in catechol pathway